MKFKYNEETNHIESDDPNVSVFVSGALPQSGFMFVLNMDGKHIGFGTAMSPEDNTSEMLADGTKVWRIGILGNHVWRSVPLQGTIMTTPKYRFTDEDEQRRVMGIISEALTAYDGRLTRHRPAGTGLKARMEYTKGLLKQVADGELLKWSPTRKTC